MDLVFYIYSFLQEKDKQVEIPELGIFFIQEKHASLNEEKSKISPPTQVISFKEKKDVFDPSLSRFIAEKTGHNLFIIQSQIKDTIQEWKDRLPTEGRIDLHQLGVFTMVNDEIILESSSPSLSPNYFGLEEISIEKISPKAQKPEEKRQKNNSSSKSILWLVSAVILGALIFFGIKNKDLILGKTPSNSIKAENKPKPTTDTIKNSKDSIIIDDIIAE
jgi:hypothetical protein